MIEIFKEYVMSNYQRTITYEPDSNEKLTLRELLKKWLIPKKWQHFLRVEKQVTINGQYHPFNTVVNAKDVIHLNFDFPPRNDNQTYLPGKNELNIAYEDNDVLIVNKPANIKSHPNLPTESDSLMNDAESYLSPAGHPYMVHRIDMLTSGLVLISKTPYLVPIFNRQLTTKTLKREYLAVVKLLKPINQSGSINLPIGDDPSDVRKQRISSDGLAALTDYKILRKNNDFALIKLNLHTGRTHQIRVHLASQGWPIVNDVLYNREKPNGNMMLCAYKLTYQIPFSNKFRTTEIEPPTFMTDFIQKKD
ncbi:RluA family pseudouridine synthase [Companilactobacillus mishanensis]|uniref:RluA family pseudouridine synthase n=1 Tax=Companilactobacillus mishanensis TaxID=2486008 RepID=UPI001EE87AA6|nr:RluA family pseudouridine synthase [Companilactobacillus mishanensis]